MEKADTNVRDLTYQFQDMKVKQVELDRNLRSVDTEFHHYREITDKLNSSSILKEKYDVDLKEIYNQITNLKYGLKDLNSNSMTTDNYLDKYVKTIKTIV